MYASSAAWPARVGLLLVAITSVAAAHARDELKGNSSTTAAPLATRPSQMFVGLSVADVKVSEAWYREIFGMKPVFATEFDNGAVSVLETEWLMVELMHQDDAQSFKERLPDTPNFKLHGVFKLGLFIDDLDGVLARLAGKGVKPMSQIYVDKVNKTRNVFVGDPDGNRWQLFERTAG